MMKYEIEKTNGGALWVKVLEQNKKKEKMTIEISATYPFDKPFAQDKNSLPFLWYKHGWTDKVMENYICCHTYVSDSEGNCCGIYNPTHKTEVDKDGNSRGVVNFEWLLEDTEENRQKIINECIRLFESATGKSATEIKEEKIIEYAKENNMQILREIPEGWEVYNHWNIPVGTKFIANMRPLLKNRKYNPDYKGALLIEKAE